MYDRRYVSLYRDLANLCVSYSMELPETPTNPRDDGSEQILVPQVPNETATVVPKRGGRAKTGVAVLHCDIIGDEFWAERPYILAS